ncbi:MAG: head GIN domain-containing protein [Bacteroidales bacterium]
MRKFILLSVFFSGLALFFTSCQKQSIGGNGIVKDKTYALHGFHALSLKGAFEVHLFPSDSFTVRIVADENLIPEIGVEVSDSTLEIAPRKNIIRSRELKLYIGSPEIRSIVLSGASEVTTDTMITSPHLNISISGTGKLSLKLQVSTLSINISGGAEVILMGKAKQFNSSITGVGKIEAQNFLTDTSNIEISGYGHVSVNTSRLLSVNVSGFGKVFYLGNPVIKQNVTGSAKIKQKQNGSN